MIIENWKSAYRMHSVQLASALALVAGLEPFIPQLAAMLPDGWASFAAVLIIVARLASQKSLQKTTPQEVWDEAMKAKDRK
jgi:hypothetical protein